MVPYFLVWSFLAFLAIASPRSRLQGPASLLFIVFFTLFIGLRDQVGGDWGNYYRYLLAYSDVPFAEVFTKSEPGYGLLNWLGVASGGGVYFVNIICGLIFSIGLLAFCNAQPRPWLALTLAFPYLVLVVAMGYSRQGVAIGIVMLALLSLQRERLVQFLLLIGLAATFHRPVLVMLVLPAATISSSLRASQWIRLIFLSVAGYGLYTSVLASDLADYLDNYVGAEYQSEGALIRVVLCLAPALVFLFNRQQFKLKPTTQRIWTLLSLLAVSAAIGLFTVASSTAVDRLALYLIPLQLFVWSRVPEIRLFGLSPGSLNQLLVLFSLAIMTVWLFFAGNSYAWLPYSNLLLV